MRYVIGSSVVMAAMMAAGTAHATDAAPLVQLSLVSATVAATAVPAEPQFRLGTLVDPSAATPTVKTDDDTGRLRHGYGQTMSFFPLGNDGFHIGGGTRFWSRGVARPSVEPAYAQLLYVPRAMLARATRRMTPALTAGYSRIVAQGMTLGVEGGAMLGKFDSLAGTLVRAPRLRGGDANDGAGRFNQVARLTFGYHF